jgi:hypothetical protein
LVAAVRLRCDLPNVRFQDHPIGGPTATLGRSARIILPAQRIRWLSVRPSIATCIALHRLTNAERVKRRRDKMRAAGLRPVQIWVPDTRTTGFAAECRRQCELIAAAERTDERQSETEFWERVSADARNDLG